MQRPPLVAVDPGGAGGGRSRHRRGGGTFSRIRHAEEPVAWGRRWLSGRPVPTIASVTRATATVVFTDLVGSTELRGRLGEEAAEELRRTHDRLLAQAVEAKGGRVVKHLGDGLMATFTGASDGVAAAVAIQQAIDRLNRSGQASVPLGVRVGLLPGRQCRRQAAREGTKADRTLPGIRSREVHADVCQAVQAHQL